MSDVENFDGRAFTVDPNLYSPEPLKADEEDDKLAVLDELALPLADLARAQAGVMAEFPFLNKVGINIEGSSEVGGKITLHRDPGLGDEQISIEVEGALGRGLRNRLGKPIPANWDGKFYWYPPRATEPFVNDGQFVTEMDSVGWWVDLDKKGGEVEARMAGIVTKALPNGASVKVGDITHFIRPVKQ